ncbi:zinc finger protein Xfin-like [Anopheles nili]|uniref:zinc finger protein Xfin-like n=1 Tax=Anopheles nili TaxID=185578 RepID=UPI00237B5564|nr:zinc finger protein Xfin-like [Anopheles nili]
MHRTSDKFLSVKNIIQPWLLKSMRKHWEWCCPMLDVESLYHIYKCMGNFCCFTTDNTSAMINHLEKHDDASGILSCSYCAVGTNSITELIDHIQRHHGQCRYQCKFCFYRSLDAANVYNHLQLYHLEEHSSTESILQIPQHPEIPRVHYMTDAVKAKVRHKMLKCTVCHENFLVIASYIQHMQLEHHSNVITCCWCLKTIKKYAIATHLLTHYIGIYECLFCEYACNIKQSMQRHLSNVHSSKPLFCSKRRECKDHKTSITEGKMLITCRHCLLPLQTISAFITHLTVHRLNQYVCFLCCYKHFLLTSVVSHICKDHSCTTVQLSFAHPKKKNLLCDIIVVMPGRLSEAEKRKCIQRTIAMGVNSLDKLSKKPKTCTKPLSASQSASNNVEINQVNLPIDPDAFPKAIHYSTIYKCGFCCKVETSKLSFQKHVIDCSCRNAVYYPCAHCGKSLKFWINRTHRILEHLLFHGENLYYCESCNYFHYSFDNVAMHIRMNHISTCAIKVLRESLEQWECNVCQIRSSMRQKIMEHMQNDHDLPGERFMCSLCNHRVFTNMEGLSHFKSTHPGKKVLMIEMYHLEQDNSSTSESADTDSSNDLDLVDVDREKDTVPLSSCSGQSDGNRSASASVVAQEIDDSNEITNHSKMQSGNEATNPAIISSSIAMKFKIKGSSVEKAHGLPDISSLKDHEQCSSNSSTVSDGLTNEQITSQLLEDKKTTSSVGRRLSKRVAVKKDVSYRWSDCTKFACIFCECSFELFSSLQKHCSIVHKSQSKAFLTDPNVAGNQMESIIAFRLRVLVCCFYCDVRDTYASLRLHHDKKHFPLSFICTDYWNIFKCGLCAYLNGSGNENEFRMHFNHFHSRYSEKTSPYDHVDDAFLEWALTHGKKVNKEDNSKNIIVKYICSQCDEQNENELEMGIHIARHIMTFKCTYCEIHYRNLKVLYEHVITIHRKKDYSVPSSCPLSYDRTLLDVEMCFINGFIISKREAQFTSHGSLQNLEKGFQMYYDSQLDELVKYKETLLMPIFEADEIVSRTSCKTFIQNQSSYPCLKITCLDIDSKSYEK